MNIEADTIAARAANGTGPQHALDGHPDWSHVQAVHHNLARFEGILPQLVRALGVIALDPALNDYVQAGLEAARAGVDPGVFASAAKAMRGHAEMQPPGNSPAFLPAPIDHDRSM